MYASLSILEVFKVFKRRLDVFNTLYSLAFSPLNYIKILSDCIVFFYIYITKYLSSLSFFNVLMQTLKVLRTADFAPLVVFIAPTNTAAQVLNCYLNTLECFNPPNSIRQTTSFSSSSVSCLLDGKPADDPERVGRHFDHV